MPVRVVIHSSVVSTSFVEVGVRQDSGGNGRAGAGDRGVEHRSSLQAESRDVSGGGARGANSSAFSRIFSGTPCRYEVVARRGSRCGTALAFERPCPMRQAPFTPRSGAPPYSL